GAIVLRAMPSNAAALGICPTPLYPAHAEAKALLSRLWPVFALPMSAPSMPRRPWPAIISGATG
ncbi:MAG TPA: hypothetical protein VGH25_02655, partial [Dongiaceae bacterium]